jgi:non-heme chloroperoxidase
VFTNRERYHLGTVNIKDALEAIVTIGVNGQPIIFSHGWPLSRDGLDAQMLFFL